jgi:hypothetical protein
MARIAGGTPKRTASSSTPTFPLGVPVVYPVPQQGGQRAVSHRAAQPIARQTTMPATNGRRGLKAVSITPATTAAPAYTNTVHAPRSPA